MSDLDDDNYPVYQFANRIDNQYARKLSCGDRPDTPDNRCAEFCAKESERSKGIMTNPMKRLAFGIGSFAPLLGYIIPLFMILVYFIKYGVSKDKSKKVDKKYVYFLLLTGLCTFIGQQFGSVCKKITGVMLGEGDITNSPWADRPLAVESRGKGCPDANPVYPSLCRNVITGKPTCDIGMPSGHSLTISSMATFVTWGMIRSYKDTAMWKRVMVILMVWIIALGVMWQRVHLDCHYTTQVFVGCTLGIAWGSMFFTLTGDLINDEPVVKWIKLAPGIAVSVLVLLAKFVFKFGKSWNRGGKPPDHKCGMTVVQDRGGF